MGKEGRNEILPILSIADLFPFFFITFGRSTKELYTIIGALILQQAFDLTNMETIEQLSFNIQCVPIFRAAAAKAARNRANGDNLQGFFSPGRIIKIVKELFCFF